MDIRHLRYFVAVADELHFTRAAQKLGIAQPPLSQQIQQLEREIGALLFTRAARGVALTEAGHRFSKDARQILRAIEESIGNAQRAARGEIGSIAIGFTPSASFHPLVMGTIRAFRTASPNVGVNLVELPTTGLIKELYAKRVDAAFLRLENRGLEDFNSQRLLSESMMVALPAFHPLSKRDAVALAELSTDVFVLYPRHHGNALYDEIVSACEKCGFTPNVGQEAPQMASTVHLVAAGVGISIVPSSMCQIAAEGVSYRPIRGIAPQASLSLVSQKFGIDGPLKHFLSLASESFGVHAKSAQESAGSPSARAKRRMRSAG